MPPSSPVRMTKSPWIVPARARSSATDGPRCTLAGTANGKSSTDIFRARRSRRAKRGEIVLKSLVVAGLLVPAAVSGLVAQEPPGKEGSSNMHVVAHIPMGSHVRTGDVEIEQELSRPYAY